MENTIRLENIVKHFPGVCANDHISLTIKKGEVHALLGENGAGKTTLMNVLYGLLCPDFGQIFLNGEAVEIRSPKEAIEHGIGMVHQHFMLIPVFTVTENVVLGEDMPREPLLDIQQAEQRVKEISHTYGLDVDPKSKVWHLSVGAQQRVEIIKALYRNAKILILDEPTAVLTPSEVDILFKVLRKLVEEGLTVIFISHKLQEVMEICDRVTVLRNGRVVDTVETSETNQSELARMMVGREVFLQFDKEKMTAGEKVLEVKGVSALSDRGVAALQNISLDVHCGEIVGIAGVDGNGQCELVDAIMGLRKIDRGSILIKGKKIKENNTREIIQRGVSCIPFDRHAEGLVKSFSLSEVLMLKEWNNLPFTRHYLFDFNAIRSFSEGMVREYDIRAPGIEVKTGNLSGGNQQKVVLARELSRKPDLIIAGQPTRGLDVGATEYVRQRLLAERARGAGILLISTELEEILSISDRLLVIYEGQIMGEMFTANADLHDIGLMMAGVKRQPDGQIKEMPV
ncbi:MAG: ABC transporter ATP-binding protein [Anaerolineaceae bacterium]|nr:ABC transporter ATP-binding protein [Anaerolineaceae bacterium]